MDGHKDVWIDACIKGSISERFNCSLLVTFIYRKPVYC